MMSTIHLHINANGQAVVSATEDPHAVTVATFVADKPQITREQALVEIGANEQIVEMITVPNGFIVTTILTTP
jgi:hypothetical protein